MSWLNFYDYRRQRENEKILERIYARGVVETEEEVAVYQEMAKARRQLDPGTEAQPEFVKIPISIDNDDIHYLTQFLQYDWRVAYAFKYNNWLKKVTDAKEEGKIEQVPDWIFTPPTAKGGLVYFVYIGGPDVFYKLDAESDDQHFGDAQGTEEERKKYQLNYPHGGLYGYEIAHPVLIKKGTDYNYSDAKDKADVKEGEGNEDALEPGEEQYSFGTYVGMSRKRAGNLLQQFLRRNAEGWNTLSQPFSGTPLANEAQQQRFLSLPRRQIVKPGRQSKQETNAVPMLTQDIIVDQFNNNPKRGNAARLEALQSMEESDLNNHGLTKYEWMCSNCRKSFPEKEEEHCPHCKSENVKPNILHTHISKMMYGSKDEDGVGIRIYPVLKENKVVYMEGIIPYLKPQRMIQLHDWEKYEPKTLDFYKPQSIDGKLIQIEPLFQKIKAVRNGLNGLSNFFAEVQKTTSTDANFRIEEIEAETQKKGDRSKIIKKLGDELAAIWARLDIQKQMRQHNITSMDSFESLVQAYLEHLTKKSYGLISGIKTGDVYDANIHQRQKNYKDTFRCQPGHCVNTGYNPNKDARETRNATQEYIDLWNAELVKFFGQSGGIHKATGLYTVDPYLHEAGSTEMAEITDALRKLEVMDANGRLVGGEQFKLIKKRDAYPKDSAEYNKLEVKIRKNQDKISELRLRQTDKLAPSPVAQGIQAYVNALKSKGGINRIKGEALESGFALLMRGSLRLIKGRLGFKEFLELQKAEKAWQKARDDDGDIKSAFTQLKESLEKLRKLLYNTGRKYATLMWQLSIGGQPSRKRIAKGDMTQSGDVPVGDNEKGFLDLVIAAEEGKRHVGMRDEYEDAEGQEDVLDPEHLLSQSPQARRQRAIQAQDELVKAQSVYGLDGMDLTIAKNLAQVYVSVSKKRAVLLKSGKSDEQIEKEMEEFIRHLKQKTQVEREEAETAEEEERLASERPEREERLYKVGTRRMTPQEILQHLDDQYQRILKGYDPTAAFPDPKSPKVIAQSLEALNKTIDNSLSDPYLRRNGIAIRDKYEPQFTRVTVHASLLDPDILIFNRQIPEQVVQKATAAGSEYKGVDIPPELIEVIKAALDRMKPRYDAWIASRKAAN